MSTPPSITRSSINLDIAQNSSVSADVFPPESSPPPASWEDFDGVKKLKTTFAFSRTNKELDFIKQIFSDDILKLTVEETNLYASPFF
ncbi:hypothetical protein JTB14_032367 [Gonioctena quinquepunctata]|nr:hypothetical protein JTB14_032367 [Gonioctena quinquepunctata]